MTRPEDPYAANPGYPGYPADLPRPVPPGEPRPLDAVESLTQGTKALFSNVLPWVLAMLIVLAVTVILTVVLVAPVALREYAGEEQAVALSPATVAALVLVWLIVFVLGMVWTLNVYRNAVRQVQGEPVDLSDFFRLRELGVPFVAYVLMGLVTFVGMLLLVIPGLVAAVLLMFVPYLAFSRPESGLNGIFRGSVDIVRANPGHSLLLVLFSLLLNAVGSLTVVGVLITAPLNACMMAHAALQGSGDRLLHRS
ncbi:hypothetical protein B842_10575 [Corynebacterium humireducens NBRC 106098 = DSM 45392]|uniref:Glycerophosphoryl diester phosphodiesterase membrane domain-containing protein n=1 Tax=Corynebacterium humireducens NBRC 106098 = DSM 45392 TaxID=1223515 RepID=A0A0B5DE08_9CORY|nr:hypothetical protein [Corynebacterium humireducens]AJE33964.1 hypothetical protein B842_10575 [Corynebacterium humireducens NBRC 106098 = DSM 45392]